MLVASFEGHGVSAKMEKGLASRLCYCVEIPHQGIWLWASAFSPGLLLAQEKMPDSGEALVCLGGVVEVAAVESAKKHP